MSEDQTPLGRGRPRAIDRFAGAALMAVGALMTVLCGLCSLAFMGALSPSHDISPMWPIAAVIGGIPTLLGIAMVVVGFMMFSGRFSPP